MYKLFPLIIFCGCIAASFTAAFMGNSTDAAIYFVAAGIWQIVEELRDMRGKND